MDERWGVGFKVGRVYILHESAVLATYTSIPRLGHLQQALNMLYYLEHSISKGWFIFDPYDYDVNWNPIRPNEMPPTEKAEAMKQLYYC